MESLCERCAVKKCKQLSVVVGSGAFVNKREQRAKENKVERKNNNQFGIRKSNLE